MLYAVIMAGGSGTRMWPVSRKQNPKQALRLIGDRTMFQHAVARLAPLFSPDRIVVVTNQAMAEVLRPQTPQLPPGNFIVEPSGRDSAPAAGLAAVHLLKRDADAVMVMLTADHYIVDTEQFRAALAAAGAVARDGRIVTLGIKPSYPSTGFGYVQLGQSDIMEGGFGVYHCAGFTEKPDLLTAVHFLEEGRHFWNSGMFVWRADRLMREYEAQLPRLHEALQKIDAALDAEHGQAAIEAAWLDAPKVSIDYGIMEHATRVAVIPVDIGWSDVGSWAALYDVLPGDEDQNVTAGDGGVIAVDTQGCLVRAAGGRLVAAIGLRDMVIVDTPDALLVCPRERAQDVKEVVTKLASSARSEYL